MSRGRPTFIESNRAIVFPYQERLKGKHISLGADKSNRSEPVRQGANTRPRSARARFGQNLDFERRAANGHLGRVPELLSELVAVKVNLIVTNGYPAARVAKERTKLPVVMGARPRGRARYRDDRQGARRARSRPNGASRSAIKTNASTTSASRTASRLRRAGWHCRCPIRYTSGRATPSNHQDRNRLSFLSRRYSRGNHALSRQLRIHFCLRRWRLLPSHVRSRTRYG